VTETEPLPPGSPLWHAPKPVYYPAHQRGQRPLWPRETKLLVDLLERWFDGRELFNVVDLARGY